MPLAAITANVFHWFITSSDSGTSTDQAVLSVFTSDSAAGVETHSSTALLTLTDSGSASETQSPSALLTLTDSGSSAETQLVFATLVVTDSATTSSIEEILQGSVLLIIVDDQGIGNDVASTSASILVSDLATETEAAFIAFSQTDSAHGSDDAAIRFTVTDSAIGFDFVSSPNNGFIIRSLKPRFFGPFLKWQLVLAQSKTVASGLHADWLIGTASSKWRFLMGTDEEQESWPKESGINTFGVSTKWTHSPPHTKWTMELRDDVPH